MRYTETRSSKGAAVNDEFENSISSLCGEDQALVRMVYVHMTELGYTPRIRMIRGQKPGWVCNYCDENAKRVLCTAVVNSNQWSLRCDLLCLVDYQHLLDSCTEAVRTALATAVECRYHGQSCAGPIRFLMNGQTYQKCRHMLLMRGLKAMDLHALFQLIDAEHARKEWDCDGMSGMQIKRTIGEKKV